MGTAAQDLADRWYEVVAHDQLRQGDIFRGMLTYWLPDGLPLVEPAPTDSPLSVKVQHERGDWIILSASCDIDRGNSQLVLLARVLEATDEHLDVSDDKARRERLEILKRGWDPPRFLLAAHPSNPSLPLSFVGYRTQVLLPIEYVRRNATGQRLRLRPPQREKFGVWVGANISRIGIEVVDQIDLGKTPFIGPTQVLRSVRD